MTSRRFLDRSRNSTRQCLVGIVIALMASGIALWSRFGNNGLAQVETAIERRSETSASQIQISAKWSQEWRDGDTSIALCRGNCRLVQGGTTYSANSAVIWAEKPEGIQSTATRLTVYLEDNVVIDELDTSRQEQTAWVTLNATDGVSLDVQGTVSDRSGANDPLFRRAMRRQSQVERGRLRQTQLTVVPVSGTSNPPGPPIPYPAPAGPALEARGMPPAGTFPNQNISGQRRIRISPRSFSIPFDLKSYPAPNTTPPEQVTTITGGVNVLIEGYELGGLEQLGAVDLSADRVVIWTERTSDGQISTDSLQREDMPYQLYLEGNVVVRQQSQFEMFGEVNNVVRADRVFYDAREKRALILDAELKSYLPDMEAAIRIRAERLRQNSMGSFHAQNAWFTTSQYGKPGYRIQSSDIFIDARDYGWFGKRGEATFDPKTGELVNPSHYWVKALNSQLIVEDTPLLTVPEINAAAEDPGLPITGIAFGQDSIFGTQVRTKWDPAKLFNLPQVNGLQYKTSLLLDFLSERGPAIGFDGKYSGIDRWGNRFEGRNYSYLVYDGGRDNLGFDRQSLDPSTRWRGVEDIRHRHYLDQFNMLFEGELGVPTDRNFRESYREREFDNGKDLEVSGLLRQQFDDNWVWSLQVRPNVVGFENNTSWLPRGDLYGLGEPLFGGPITWSSHTSAAYASLNRASVPSNPLDVFTPLPYYTDADGLVAMTRHELQAPFNLGPLKVVPYALGEAAFWGDSFAGTSIDRLYGRAGVRGSLSFWRAFPQVRSDILNLNGLAHKVMLNADYGYAASSRSITEIPQWNEFDDNAQERFRSRFLSYDFGGVLPVQFDPRLYAIRAGAGGNVADPYHELVDDQQVLRLGLHQRWQTKVGMPGRERIKDWMTLDLGASFFPNATRDNFGEDFGLFNGRYVWNVGDRTSLVASGIFDTFKDGQQIWNVGVVSQRSLRGSIYVGLREIKAGPIDSRILTASYSYALSPKWVTTMTTAYDLGEGRNRGQAFTITRVGEWFLVHFGANYDASKNNPGAAISVEPRFGRRNPLSSVQLNPNLGNSSDPGSTSW